MIALMRRTACASTDHALPANRVDAGIGQKEASAGLDAAFATELAVKGPSLVEIVTDPELV